MLFFFCLQLKAVKISSDPRYLQGKKTTNMEEGELTLAPSGAEEPGNQSIAGILLEERCNYMKTKPCATEIASSGGLNLNVPVAENLSKRKVTNQSDTALCDVTLLPDDLQSSCKKQKKISDTDVVTAISDYNKDLNVATCDENKCIIASASLTDSLEHTSNKLIISGSTCYGEHENVGDEPKDVTTEAEFRQSSNSMEVHVEEMQSLSEWKPLEKQLYMKGVEMFGRNRYGAFCFVLHPY